VNKWAPCFEEDLARMGLEGQKTLVILDNLDAQRTPDFVQEMADMQCRCVYGPRNGTDVWQPIDHGIGVRYQNLVGQYYDEWCGTEEAEQLFENKEQPSAERVRQLLVDWVHKAYLQLEAEREEKEAKGEPSIFELAFLRTGCLVSANGDAVDSEMDPEGCKAAMEKSADPYYQQHGISTFQDLLRCSDQTCGHGTRRVVPPLPEQQRVLDNDEKVRDRFKELEGNSDPRCQLLVKCLKAGMIWAGSSYVHFLAFGTDSLLDFLSARAPAQADASPSPLLHDVDLYRKSKVHPGLGKRFIGKGWSFEATKARAVDKCKLKHAATGLELDIDQVNLFKSNFQPSTDLWPNLCASIDTDGNLTAQLLFPAASEHLPLAVTLDNALKMGDASEEKVDCYMLRAAIYPKYDSAGALINSSTTCDGRFAAKLHERKVKVNLVPFFDPGPVVAALTRSKRLTRSNGLP
jgi:hypothetical protein